MTHGIHRPGCCPARHVSPVRISCAYPFPEGWLGTEKTARLWSIRAARSTTDDSFGRSSPCPGASCERSRRSFAVWRISELDREDSPRVLAADPISDIAREGVDPCKTARHVPDVVGIVGAVEHVLGAADADRELEGFLPEDDRVDVDPPQVLAGRHAGLGSAGRNLFVADVE